MAYTDLGGGNPFGFRITRGVKYLLIANTVVFLATLLFRDAVYTYLGLVPSQVLTRPWTPLTYMFVHAGLGHFFFNMLALFFFGPPLEEHWGNRDFGKVYLGAGLAGAALSLLFPTSLTVGASGAIYGLLAAYAYLWPDNLIYFWGIFPIKAKWFVIGLVSIGVLMSVTNPFSGVAHLAHLGGAVAGFLAVRFGLVGGRWGKRPTRRGKTLATPTHKIVQRARALVRDRKKAAASPPPGLAHRGVRAEKQRERQLLDDVDRILEKISAQGMSSLSKDELDCLTEASRRTQAN